METIDFKKTTTGLHQQITKIDFAQLPISDYNKKYLQWLLPALHYYLEIYAGCIQQGIEKCGKEIRKLTLVDYGGGSGFLSMLAKEIGIGKVIYIDLNEKSVETVRLLQAETGVGPDIILHGDSEKLTEWCSENAVRPDLLIATDVIEHIYDLSDFFSQLISINDRMEMIFTTASTPYNPYVKHRLHRLMQNCETGQEVIPNYYTKRANYIQKTFPDLSEQQVSEWTLLTRGLIYEDIYKAISQNKRPLLLDAYNTCDPATGNWAERILPIRDYKTLVAPYNYKVEVKKGFYNSQRPKQWKSVISFMINQVVKYSGKAGFVCAPFIYLLFSRK